MFGVGLFCLRQVNGMNVAICLFDACLSVCAQRTGQSDRFKTVKATDFKFDNLFPVTVTVWT